jgi:hypothetical protein
VRFWAELKATQTAPLWSKAMRNLREIDFHPGVSANQSFPSV